VTPSTDVSIILTNSSPTEALEDSAEAMFSSVITVTPGIAL